MYPKSRCTCPALYYGRLILLVSAVFSSGVLCTAQTSSSFNVKNYGAVGNGVVDDTTAIKKTIAAANAAGPTSVVYLPAGTYKYSDNLCVADISFMGAGKNATVLLAADSTKTAITLSGQQPLVSDFTLKTQTPPTTRSNLWQASGVQVYNSTTFTIRSVIVSRVASAGILVRQAIGSASNRSSVSDCEVEGTLADGIQVTQSTSYLDVHDNLIHETGDDFIGVVSYRNFNPGMVHDVRIYGNTMTNQTNGRGITVVGGDSIQIYNNAVSKSAGSGIYLASESTYDTFGVSNISVQRNTVVNCPSIASQAAGHSAINLSGRANSGSTDLSVNNIDITSNTILGGLTQGITVRAFTDSITIRGNFVQNVSQDGVIISGTTASPASTILFAGNRIEGTGCNGITVGPYVSNVNLVSDGLLKERNVIKDAGYYAVYVNSTGAGGILAINGLNVDSVNLKGTLFVDVINVSAGGSPTLSIDNVQFVNTRNTFVERFIESRVAPTSFTGCTGGTLRSLIW